VKKLFMCIALVAACGPKSKPADTTTDTTDTTTDTTEPSGDAAAAELAAYQAAKPAFDEYCGECHTQSGAKATEEKLHHIDMTAYPFTGGHTESLGPTILHVLGLDGSEATMPKQAPGTVPDDALKVIEAWAAAWQAADDAGTHPQ
jgi:mono/diheme cytochrome c family protein